MCNQLLDLFHGVRGGQVVPYLGADALHGVVHLETGRPIPADSDSLILAMNDGKPMSPKLMFEFSRAAMNLELKRGRSFVNRFLTQTYGDDVWTRSELHASIAALNPPYVIDINRDTQLQTLYADRPHVLITGISRIGGTDYRFKTYRLKDGRYVATDHTLIDKEEKILFKPMGTPVPEPNYIASDADYVDYLTELMGGFGIPGFVKERRVGKQYLTIGLRMTRDTERMTLSDIVYAAGSPCGWAVIENPSDKERRFCASKDIHVIEASVETVLETLRVFTASCV